LLENYIFRVIHYNSFFIIRKGEIYKICKICKKEFRHSIKIIACHIKCLNKWTLLINSIVKAKISIDILEKHIKDMILWTVKISKKLLMPSMSMLIQCTISLTNVAKPEDNDGSFYKLFIFDSFNNMFLLHTSSFSFSFLSDSEISSSLIIL